jgi:hypothetical protein
MYYITNKMHWEARIFLPTPSKSIVETIMKQFFGDVSLLLLKPELRTDVYVNTIDPNIGVKYRGKERNRNSPVEVKRTIQVSEKGAEKLEKKLVDSEAGLVAEPIMMMKIDKTRWQITSTEGYVKEITLCKCKIINETTIDKNDEADESWLTLCIEGMRTDGEANNAIHHLFHVVHQSGLNKSTAMSYGRFVYWKCRNGSSL